MWSFILYCSIFAMGSLAVYIDWEFFINELISIKNIENSVRLNLRDLEVLYCFF